MWRERGCGMLRLITLFSSCCNFALHTPPCRIRTAVPVLLMASLGCADTVVLSSGKEVSGIIYSENAARVSIQTDVGVLEVPRSTVLRVAKSSNPKILAIQHLLATGKYDECAKALKSPELSTLSGADAVQLKRIADAVQKGQESTRTQTEKAMAEEQQQRAQQQTLAEAQEREQRVKESRRQQEAERAARDATRQRAAAQARTAKTAEAAQQAALARSARLNNSVPESAFIHAPGDFSFGGADPDFAP